MEIILENISLTSLFEHFGWIDEFTFCGGIEVTSGCPYEVVFFEIHLDENRIVYSVFEENEERMCDDIGVKLNNTTKNLDELVIAFAKMTSLDYEQFKQLYVREFNCSQNLLDILEIAEKYSKEELKKYFFRQFETFFDTDELIKLSEEIKIKEE